MDASNPCHVQIHVQQLDSFDAEKVIRAIDVAEGQGAPEFHGHKWWRKNAEKDFHSSDMLGGVSEIFQLNFLKKWELVLDVPAPNFLSSEGLIVGISCMIGRYACSMAVSSRAMEREGDPCLGYTIYTREN